MSSLGTAPSRSLEWLHSSLQGASVRSKDRNSHREAAGLLRVALARVALALVTWWHLVKVGRGGLAVTWSQPVLIGHQALSLPLTDFQVSIWVPVDLAPWGLQDTAGAWLPGILGPGFSF